MITLTLSYVCEFVFIIGVFIFLGSVWVFNIAYIQFIFMFNRFLICPWRAMGCESYCE